MAAPDPSLALAAALFALAALPAQAESAPAAPAPAVAAKLIAAGNWSWQCDPIRFSLRVANAGADAMVRPKYSSAPGALFPFEIEREHVGRWEPVRPQREKALDDPARFVTSPGGQRIPRGDDFAFEVDLFDLDAVSVPGRVRIRFALEQRDASVKGAAWSDLPTPWLEIAIREHLPNAAALLGDRAADLRARYEALSRRLNWTQRGERNQGPFNPGPGGMAHGNIHGWQRHAETAEQLLAAADLSWRLRARAHLVLAWYECELAGRAGGDAAEAHLRAARAHLEAEELAATPPSAGIAALPSGGLVPMRRMLFAHIARRLDGESAEAVYRELCAAYPFFTAWWRVELEELLLR
ncbi:MAG: hypothetical protein U1E73_00790 [Planctomycetota bacterium]